MTPRESCRMCHRLLKFVKHTTCGHNAFTGDDFVDCRSKSCALSASHPPDCTPCKCRRYYGQPERIITQQVSRKCSNCPQ